MSVQFSSRIRPAANVLVRELEGEAVLLNLDNESYYGLDEIGARMWSAVTAGDSIEDAYEALVAEYDVEPDRLRDDLLSLIEAWIENGLARIDEG